MTFLSAARSVFRRRRTFASDLALLKLPTYVVSACAIAMACSGAPTAQRAVGRTVSALGAAGPVVGLAQKCLDVQGANTASGTPRRSATPKSAFAAKPRNWARRRRAVS